MLHLHNHHPTHQQCSGQALVEFVFVIPILLGFMLFVWAVGTWMYSGTNASSSLRAIMDNQYRYANSANAFQQIRGDATSISTGPLIDLGTGVDTVTLIGNGSLFPVVQGQKAVNLLGAAGILNIPAVTVFGSFMVNGGLFFGNASPIQGAPGAVPYNTNWPGTATNINPLGLGFSDANQLPSSVPITDDCHANLKGFDNQAIDVVDPTTTCYDPTLDAINNVTGASGADGILDFDFDNPPDGVAELDDPCKVALASTYVSQHLQAVQAMDGCNPNAALTNTSVTFRGPNDYGY